MLIELRIRSLHETALDALSPLSGDWYCRIPVKA